MRHTRRGSGGRRKVSAVVEHRVGQRRRVDRGEVFADLPELETERLLLRRMRRDDAQAMFAYASDPEVTRYVLFDTHRSLEDSEAFLRFAVGGYERGDFGGWGVVLKDSGVFIGTCGVDVNYAPEHARAVIRFGFGRLELNRIQARCVAENTASARVMEKVGMTYEGTLRESEYIKGAFRDMKIYSILRREL
jgi:[ribosomal protein S5]-alanine N-acetyltransferase